MDKVKLIESLIKKLEKITKFDFVDANGFKDHAEMIITNVFGPESKYIPKIRSVHFFSFSSGMASNETNSEREERAWNDGVRESQNLIDIMLEDLEIARTEDDSIMGAKKITIDSNKIFIVHGHDTEMLAVVARAIEKLGLEPVILNEQPDKGRTLIEKFEGHSDVSCAIILFSPDDVGYSIKEGSDSAKPRARQNVILELGFFVGRLGRERVIALGKDAMKLEIPTDYVGVLLKEYDSAGAWKMKLVNELKEIGYDIDANKLS